jgi:hypothetical protein
MIVDRSTGEIEKGEERKIRKEKEKRKRKTTKKKRNELSIFNYYL